MNAIDLYEQHRLLSLWRLTEVGGWKLVELTRPGNAKYRCRHDAEGNLYAFLPDSCPANIYQGDYAAFVSQKPRQAVSLRHKVQNRPR